MNIQSFKSILHYLQADVDYISSTSDIPIEEITDIINGLYSPTSQQIHFIANALNIPLHLLTNNLPSKDDALDLYNFLYSRGLTYDFNMVISKPGCQSYVYPVSGLAKSHFLSYRNDLAFRNVHTLNNRSLFILNRDDISISFEDNNIYLRHPIFPPWTFGAINTSALYDQQPDDITVHIDNADIHFIDGSPRDTGKTFIYSIDGTIEEAPIDLSATHSFDELSILDRDDHMQITYLSDDNDNVIDLDRCLIFSICSKKYIEDTLDEIN